MLIVISPGFSYSELRVFSTAAHYPIGFVALYWPQTAFWSFYGLFHLFSGVRLGLGSIICISMTFVSIFYFLIFPC